MAHTIRYFQQADKSGSGFFPIIRHYAVAYDENGNVVATTGLCGSRAGATASIARKTAQVSA